MKKLFLLVVIPGIIASATAGAQSPKDSARTVAVQQHTGNPDEAVTQAAKLLSAVKNGSGDFVKNLNLDFKTFQGNNQPVGLGFTYKYNNSWTWVGKLHDFTQSLNLNFNGDVAFKKVYNPTDFLESKAVYSASFFLGGVSERNSVKEGQAFLAAAAAHGAAVAAHDQAKTAATFAEMQALKKITNQFFITLNASPSYETNQDFSKQQFAPGAYVVLGANAYDAKSALRWLNFPDYPVALLRWITQTDDDFSPSGLAFPTVLGGIDHVIPQKDSLRKAVTGALDPFDRLRFEASMKSKAATINDLTVWLVADYRWYKELKASAAENAAGIARANYFVAALQASNGFFVSYSTGKLPFDRKSDQVYALGFHYDFGNWGKK